VDPVTGAARVRSVTAVASGKADYALLTAHPSFDVWSLGCILYQVPQGKPFPRRSLPFLSPPHPFTFPVPWDPNQMVTPDVRPLFQGGRDDTLPDDPGEEDSLRALADWAEEHKQKKLARVGDGKARNLLSQMLSKDPKQRPTLARVLAHPFISGQKVARMVGESAKYDVFLSYRVAADAAHVETLYRALTKQGLKVYWDKVRPLATLLSAPPFNPSPTPLFANT